MRLINKLRDALPEDLRGFCVVLGAFDTVAYSCFGKILSVDFDKAIDDFLDFFNYFRDQNKEYQAAYIILRCYRVL